MAVAGRRQTGAPVTGRGRDSPRSHLPPQAQHNASGRHS
jgi:hypothetical protein